MTGKQEENKADKKNKSSSTDSSQEILNNINNCIKALNDLLKDYDDKFPGYGFSRRWRSFNGYFDDMKTERIENNFKALMDQITKYFSTISIYTPNINEQGDSSSILKKFSSIHSLRKVDAKIRRMISILDSLKFEKLYYNQEIVKIKSKEKEIKRKSAYDSLKDLETQIRIVLEKELKKVSVKWWNQCIPHDVREEAEKRKSEDDSPWPWFKKGENSITAYLDFNDYLKIILKRDNWKNVFRKIFKDEDLISAKLKELDPIRKTIAHSRDLTESEFTRLKLYCSDIIQAIQTKS